MTEGDTVCFLRVAGEYALLPTDEGLALPRVDADGAARAADAVGDLVGADVDVVRFDRGQPNVVLCNLPSRERLDDATWLAPTAFGERPVGDDRAWEQYRRVAPTVETVRTDVERGSAYLSARALEVLRDAAGAPGAVSLAEVRAVFERLRSAQSAMAVIHNRLDRAVSTAATATPAAIAERAHELVGPSERADRQAATEAVDLVADRRVLTVSRSGTVLAALERASPRTVYVNVARTDDEGIRTAEAVADYATAVLCPDAALAHVLSTGDVDVVLVGADAILPDGGIVNKVGTRGVAIAAASEDVPTYAVAATDKLRADGDFDQEFRPASAVYDGSGPVEVYNPVFDVTPPSYLEGIVTERGVSSPEAVGAETRRRREHADRAARRLRGEKD